MWSVWLPKSNNYCLHTVWDTLEGAIKHIALTAALQSQENDSTSGTLSPLSMSANDVYVVPTTQSIVVSPNAILYTI